MKKIKIIYFLFLMIFSLAVPAVYAADEVIIDQSEATPIIHLRGNGETIHYEGGAGEKANIDIGEVLGDDSIYDVEGMKKEIVNILIPFITQGLPADKWDECRKAIYDAISPFFKQSGLDGDGKPQMNTTISKASQDSNSDPSVKNEVNYSKSWKFSAWKLDLAYISVICR